MFVYVRASSEHMLCLCLAAGVLGLRMWQCRWVHVYVKRRKKKTCLRWCEIVRFCEMRPVYLRWDLSGLLASLCMCNVRRMCVWLCRCECVISFNWGVKLISQSLAGAEGPNIWLVGQWCFDKGGGAKWCILTSVSFGWEDTKAATKRLERKDKHDNKWMTFKQVHRLTAPAAVSFLYIYI